MDQELKSTYIFIHLNAKEVKHVVKMTMNMVLSKKNILMTLKRNRHVSVINIRNAYNVFKKTITLYEDQEIKCKNY